MQFLLSLGKGFLLAAVAGEVLVPFLLAPFDRGYSHLTQPISSLGRAKSPVRLPFSLWMLVAGLLLLLSLPGLYMAFAPSDKCLRLLLVIFVGLFAIGACILSCFFPVGESKADLTLRAKIHGAGSVLGFLLLQFVPLLLCLLCLRAQDPAGAVLCALCFALALAGFVLLILADKPSFAGSFVQNEGLWQRLDLLFLYLPLVYAALRHWP